MQQGGIGVLQRSVVDECWRRVVESVGEERWREVL